MSHPDPAYRYEQDKLATICQDYLRAYEAGDQTSVQLLTGMMIAQCAMIYKLAPPAGLIDIAAMFKREDDDEQQGAI